MYGSEPTTRPTHRQLLIRPEYARALDDAVRRLSTVTTRGLRAALGFAVRATVRDRSDQGLEAVLSTEA